MQLNKYVLTLSLVTSMLIGYTTPSFASINANTNSQVQVEQVKYKNENKIDELVQTAIYYYWNGGDLKKAEQQFFKGITLKGKYDVVENAFNEASKLDPNRLGLKFSVGSTQIIEGKVDEALNTYKEILELDKLNFNAGILYATYSKVKGSEAEYDNTINNLKEIDSERTTEYLKKFDRTEKIISTKINTKPEVINSNNHAIVCLGYALAEDGTMQPTLVERLKKALECAKLNPNSKIIVSGGVPQSGVTESYLMKNWLIINGISSGRIYTEDASKDTVGNAINSAAMLKEIGAKDVTLITSASHMRRALVTFKEATLNIGMDINFTNLAYLDYLSLEEAQKVSNNERLVIYRDFLRTSEIWAYPGIQR